MVQAAEDGGRGQLTGCDCSSRSEPARACGRLGAQAAMRPATVIANVLAQDALGVGLAENQDVIEAVATERPHQALANRVRHRRSGRREKRFTCVRLPSTHLTGILRLFRSRSLPQPLCRSSSRWFEPWPCSPSPGGPPPSPVQHGYFELAPTSVPPLGSRSSHGIN